MQFKVISPNVDNSGNSGTDPQAQIEQMLSGNSVFLFMKGTPESPQCGFSGKITNILNNKSLPIYGKGTNSREWIYVQDHCEALIKIFEKGKNCFVVPCSINRNSKN